MKNLFLEYIYRIIDQEFYNEDIKYIISLDGTIKKESDGKSSDLESSEELIVGNFFDQLEKNIKLEQIVKIKINNTDLPSVADFTLDAFITAIKDTSEINTISKDSVMSESLRGFVFKIKSEPAKNLNDKVANALTLLKDLVKNNNFEINDFYGLLKSKGNLSSEITKEKVLGQGRLTRVITHIQQNFFGNDEIFNDFIEKIQSFCSNRVSKNIKEQFVNEFTSAKNSGGSWEITMSLGRTTGAVPRRRS
jgi:hypothetical protein